MPRRLVDNMTRDWATAEPPTEQIPMAPYAARRRERIAKLFPNTTLVIPTGNFKVRANDTNYRFRPGTDFFYLTGCHEPDAVLVITEAGDAVRSTLFVAQRRDSATHEFFTDVHHGEIWVGPRPGVSESAIIYGIETADLAELDKHLANTSSPRTLVVRGFDQHVDAQIPSHDDEHRLIDELSILRLVKDDFEVAQLQEAVDHTIAGFGDVVRALPSAIGRGERVIEGVFNLRARVEGNDVGYETIAATGSHATILHWVRNDGVVRSGDLLLLDAGVECHNLYTADVTRTMPISGTFSPAQRTVYELVLSAQRAALAAAKPGARFLDPHEAAMRVLAQGLRDLGIIEADVETAMRRDLQLYRRYTLHGTSHMLGIDVHDCANARNEVFSGALREGYIITVEPGLYFQPNDLTVPEELRGIGVRIEDDVLITADGCRVLSAGLPTDPDDVEAWMRELFNQPAPQLGL